MNFSCLCGNVTPRSQTKKAVLTATKILSVQNKLQKQTLDFDIKM